jgi:L-arabinose isomerase
MDPVDDLPPQEGDEPRDDPLFQAEQLVRKAEERVSLFQLRINAYEAAKDWNAAAAAKDTLLSLEATLELMRNYLRLVRKMRGLDP